MLENEGVELTDNNSMIDHVLQFYKKTFWAKSQETTSGWAETFGRQWTK
jgi:hypothetical protein